jgi:glyoxylase-like metal-dependent hydrolase (beta-lactamase superfamily II)
LTEFIRQDRLSERVLVVKTGVDYFDAVTAVKTRKGIVMIDAGYSPTLTKQYRAIVERAFPGTAIAFVINTHSHGDHTGGNGVFPEAVVIGHDTVPAEMGKDFSDQTRKLASLRSMIAGLKDEMNDPHLESEAKRKAVCRWRLLSRVLTDLEGDYRWTAPTLTFKDSMTLQMGDVTFKMRFFGRAHSGSDIVIEVPEEKLLMAGDLFNEGGSGNLSELNHGNVQQGDIEQWHDSMEYLLRAGPNYEHILDGHAAALSRDDLAAFGKNVEYLWNEYRSGRNYSARVRLAEVLKESGLEAMKSEYHRIKTARPNPYYFFESEFIDFGSHLLQGGEAAAAVEAFRIAAGEFPRSWRAWDWLGEACLTNGDRSTSIVSYEKSLQLNPNNDHARRTLEKMRAR